MLVFDANTLAARRARAERLLSLDAGLLLVGAGQPISIPGGHDQTHPFAPHPEYYWLTGSRRAGGILAWEPDAGWTHFVVPVSAIEKLWEGDAEAPEGLPVDSFAAWYAARAHRPTAVLGCAVAGVTPDPALTERAQQQLNVARRPKDAAELTLMRRAAAATAAGHARAVELVRPGMTERALQIELEAEMFRQGADATGYGTIVAAGSRAAVLHAPPTERIIAANDYVLIDAGGALLGYTADVTRTLAASGTFTSQQQAVYDIVRTALDAGIATARAGVEWHDVHRASARVIAQGLLDLELLRGDVDELLNSGAVANFFPHGVGHMVGLGVRDVGGRASDREAGRRTCGVAVRVDLPLEAGFVMTVEPGLYFVDAILDDPARRETFAHQVNWGALDAWRGIGGVRLEDNILITADGPAENLTAAIPR